MSDVILSKFDIHWNDIVEVTERFAWNPPKIIIGIYLGCLYLHDVSLNNGKGGAYYSHRILTKDGNYDFREWPTTTVEILSKGSQK